MEPTARGFDVEELNVSDGIKQSMKRAYEALLVYWERNEPPEDAAYRIDIPAQTLTIHGNDRAQYALRTLKSIGVTGTYRTLRKGLDHDSRTDPRTEDCCS